MLDSEILTRSSIPSVVARRSATIFAAGLALGLLALPTAHAQNLLTDGSFETTQLSQGNFVYENRTLNNWDYLGLAVLINIAGNSPWTTPSQETGYDGNQVAGIQETGSISQTFASPNTGAFDVTWLENARPGNAQNYTLSVRNDSTNAIVASETLTVTSGANFNPESLAANLVAGDTYTLTFQGLDTAVSPGADETAFIDNVQLDSAPAPVPGVLPLPLLAPFFAGFVWFHRRRMQGAA